MKLIGGIVFILAGVAAAFFFEAYSDFARRVAGARAGGSLPDQRTFINVIRIFGFVLTLIGIGLCWAFFHGLS